MAPDTPSATDVPGGLPTGSYVELLRLAGPNVLSRLGIMGMGLTDAVVVGHFSATQLGYHALGWAPTTIVLVSAIGLLFGVQVMAARHIGAGQRARTGAVLQRGIRYALALGLVSTLALYVLGPPVLGHMGLDADLAAGAGAALQIFALSLTPYLVADALWFWLEAVGRPQVPMLAMWAVNALNLALALWVVPGHSPFPVSGAVGAGWVTLVARTSFLLILAVAVWRWPEARRLGVFRRAPPDAAEAREQRRIGYAAGLSAAIETGAYSGMNFVAAELGVLAVASWAIILNVIGFVFMVPLGIAAATGVLVSRAVGAGSLPAVHRAFRRGQGVAMLLLAAVSILGYAFDGVVARIYTGDPALIAATVPAIGLACLCFMADGAQAIAANALRARDDVWWASGMHGISYLVVMLPLGWWLGVHQGQGLMGIVRAVLVASVLSGVALSARFFLLRRPLAAAPER